ncbi:MAG: nitrogenase [Bacteroidales bacterium OttesenSCG-928-I14]|jgi:nitrogenase molybdenum-iron protein NifN|nr:nitrogenase [Bacteroidales bacterium OttesenSCG-928-I14]
MYSSYHENSFSIKETRGTCNACKQCSPLGACIVFLGIENTLPMLHGSQGCATYIRRYLISHFREPVDIASSNFSEETTIFGGEKNFNTSLDNIIIQYHPKIIAVASTCLSETIGEDIKRFIYEYKNLHKKNKKLPEIIFTSTPSYKGTHYSGFHEAVYSVVESLANEGGDCDNHINLFSNFISPEDIRHLKEIVADFGIRAMIFPDYSDTLDGALWDTYQRIPPGGTSINDLKNSALASSSIELGYVLNLDVNSSRLKTNFLSQSAGEYLKTKFGINLYRIGLPVGIRETDIFFQLLSSISLAKSVPKKYEKQRGRLIDLYIDGHKYVFGKRVIIYGEEDLVVSLASFVVEVGMKPLLCVTGGESGKFKNILQCVLSNSFSNEIIIKQGATFEQMENIIINSEIQPDLMIGNSKGYYIARKLKIPLIRVGFPIHDRIGAYHNKLLCYEGTISLFEQIVNALLEKKQHNSSIGYKYM